MAISTDLNVTPYFDDFNANNQYEKILFKPAVPIQARELNQVQSVFQNQIERGFGHILKDGAIVSGVSKTLTKKDFVKIKDAFPANNAAVNIFNFANGYLVDATSNLVFAIDDVADGFEVKNPELKTIYGLYTGTGNTTLANGTVEDVEKFTSGRQVTFYPANGQISGVTISNTGTAYTNGDIVTFTGTFGANATGSIVTDASGNISSVSMTSAGQDYRYIDVITASISTAAGTGGNLVPVINAGANLEIANASFTVTGNSEFNTIGRASKLNVDEGTLFQKGSFLTVKPQGVFVKAHSIVARNMVVGFEVEETVVNSNADSTLLDNSQGFNNEKAPGADRMQLTPVLKSITVAESDASNTFFPFVRFNSEGSLIETRQQNPYSALGAEMAQKRFDSDGNYSKQKFSVTFQANTANTNEVITVVSPGVGYVRGYRNELIGKSRVKLRKGTDTANVADATFSQSFGYYVRIKEMVGTFDFNNNCEVFLMDQPGKRISFAGTSVPTVPTTNASTNTTIGSIAGTVTGAGPAYTGTVIGRARIKSIIVDSAATSVQDPNALFKAFLFDVQLAAGKSFDDARAISYFTGSNAGQGFADLDLVNDPRQIIQQRFVTSETDGDSITLEESEGFGGILTEDSGLTAAPDIPKIIEPEFKAHIRKVGRKGVKTLEPSGSSDIRYHYRTIFDGTLSTAGQVAFTLSGNQVFDYTASGTLSDEEEKEVLLVSNGTSASAQTTARTGTLTITASSNVITGTSTLFTSQLRVGDHIRTSSTGDNEYFQVREIRSNTSIQVDRSASATAGSLTYKRYLPAQMPIDLRGTTSSNVQISADQKTMTFNASRGDTLESTIDVRAYVNVRRNAAEKLNKTLHSNTFIRIDCSNNAGGTTGPWSLGIPDVHELQAVYVADEFTHVTTNLAANSATTVHDFSDHFRLQKNQKDGFYDVSSLELITPANPSKGPPTIASGSKIIPVFKTFNTDTSGGGIGFYNVDSYPVDDTTATLPTNKIRTQNIPVYVSPADGSRFDLRDSIDFRRVCANTANSVASWNSFGSIDVTSATLNPSNTVTFTGEQFNFAPRKRLVSSYEYYLPRKDSVTLSESGRVQIVEGRASDNPTPPSSDKTQLLLLGEVNLPVFPTLTARQAEDVDRPDYRITYADKQVRGYTMRDVGKIHESVKRIAQVTALSTLEKSATDLTIPSEVDPSLNRFKNGILVDNFQTTKTSSQRHPEFRASFNKALGTVSPRHTQIRIPLNHEPLTANNVAVTGNTITLAFSHKVLAEVDSATSRRTVAVMNYRFRGNLTMLPSDYDNWVDTRYRPEDQIQATIDLGASAESLARVVEQDVDFQQPSSEVQVSRIEEVMSSMTTTSSSSSQVQRGNGLFNQQITNTILNETLAVETTTTTTNSRNVLDSVETFDTINMGSFVRDIRVEPFMREQTISLYFVGVKPSTRHHVFFDKQNVDEHCRPCTVRDAALSSGGTFTHEDFEPTDVKGATLRSNNRGELFVQLHIPPQTFKVGTNEIVAMNQPSYSSVEKQPNSFAIGTHNSSNFGIDMGSSELTLRNVNFDKRRVSDVLVETENTIENRSLVVGQSVTSQFAGFISQDDDGDGDQADGDDGDCGDPLAQTFFVKPPRSFGPSRNNNSTLDGTPRETVNDDGVVLSRPDNESQEGVFVSKIDLYFAQKDPLMGVIVELVETVNHVPTDKVVPFTKVHKRPEDVATSTDATAVTTFEFSGLVFLRANKTYAIRILTDGSTPLYECWTHTVGQPDVATPTKISTKDLHEGFFYASNNLRNWTPLPHEDLKYTLYMADFSPFEGSVEFRNSNIEFMSANSMNGAFLAGEKVFKFGNTTTAGYSSGNLAGNVTFSTTNSEVTGVGTSFNTSITAGQYILLSNGSSHDVKQVQSVTNATHMDLKGFPSFASTSSPNTYVYEVATGTVYQQKVTDQGNTIILDESSANSSVKFSAGDIIIGETSDANASLTSVDDYTFHYFDNLSYVLNPAGTKVTQTMVANAATGQTDLKAYPLNQRNFLKEDHIIRSHSNQPDSKSLRIKLELNTSEGHMSPVVDHVTFDVVAYQNIINNDSTNEHDPEGGNATAKFVSKVFNLETSFAAEDLKFLLTAAKPGAANVEVYAKFSSELDPEPLETANWTKLDMLFDQDTDELNKLDIADYEFNLPHTPQNATFIDGAVDAVVGSKELVATGVSPSGAGIAAGDLVKICQDEFSANVFFQLERVASANSTVIVLEREMEFDQRGAKVQEVGSAGLRTAFKDPMRNGVLTYFNSGGNRVTGYNQVQFKIVMLSSQAFTPPELYDYRAICLTI
tara:strand:- start:8383 stop:15315 length:6933 start_codon:yes stop_codon:yes gene_type:complete